MAYPQNAWPNFKNFQEVSFPQEVTPPDVDPDVDVRCVKYNPAWAAVLAAACSQLTQLASWAGTPEEKTLAVLRATNLKIQLQEFEDCDDMGCCVPPLTRINNDGSIDMSNDGGTTWTPATGQDDPRNPTVIFAPLPGDPGMTKRCEAANSIVTAFEKSQQAYYQAKLSSETDAQLAAILLTFLVAVGVIATGGALALLGAGIAVIVTTSDAESFNAAFTDDVWSAFLCKIYCAMDGQGQLTDSDVRSIQADMAGLGGIAGSWFNSILKAMTGQSMSNYGSLGYGGTRDCSECDCGICPVTWTWYGLDDVVHDPDNPNHWSGTWNSSSNYGHIAFTSGSPSQTCYFKNPYLAYSSWSGSAPTSPDNVNPKTTPIWNFDAIEGSANGTHLDFYFSSHPI